MNLMFRKNFREGGGGGAKSGGGGTKMNTKALNRNQGNKRSRDMGYGNMDADVHYRTHIFFAPRTGGGTDCEGLHLVCNKIVEIYNDTLTTNDICWFLLKYF
jgi:hypothetical protein